MPEESVKTTPEEVISRSGVSEETLENAVVRVVKFTQGIVTNAAIRAQLRSRGMNAAELKNATDLLAVVCQIPEEPQVVGDDAVRAAFNFIDANDEEVHGVVNASLRHNYPEQHEYLTKGIGPAKGMLALVNMRTFMARWDELASGETRPQTRETDRKALALVEKRGLRTELMAALRANLKIVEDLNPETEAIRDQAFRVRRLEALVALRNWYLEWSDIARIAIKRRDHLISLGLASRRTSSGSTSEEPEDLGGPLD